MPITINDELIREINSMHAISNALYVDRQWLLNKVSRASFVYL